MPFAIEIVASAVEHLKTLRAFEQARLRDEIILHLTHEPLTETRRRKRIATKSNGAMGTAGR